MELRARGSRIVADLVVTGAAAEGTAMSSLPAPLDGLAEEDTQTLERVLEPVRFGAGSAIFRAGDEGHDAYLIDEGDVRLELPHPDIDSEGVLAYAGEGTLLGELALLDGQPRSASAYAETDVLARRLTTATLAWLSSEQPSVAAAVMQALGSQAALRLRFANTTIAEHLLTDVPDPIVDAMVSRARAAQAEFEGWDEQRVDALLADLVAVIADRAEALAQATVKETRLGDVRDKAVKNTFAAQAVYRSLAGKPGIGFLGEPGTDGVREYASPVGVVFGIVPVTNPVATAVFKTIISLKTRNALILSFQRACLNVGNYTGELIRVTLLNHRAPEHLVQWIRARTNRRKTARFMAHDGVGLILATGGPDMVRAAYRSGTPAIGVGAGNAPVWIADDADLPGAAADVVASKAFDNGLVCGAENHLVVDRGRRSLLIGALEAAGAAVLNPAEVQRLGEVALRADGKGLRREVNGQPAAAIAERAGIERSQPIRLLVVPAELGLGGPWAGEKLAPLVTLFTVDGETEAFSTCAGLLAGHGRGHTAIVHTKDLGKAERFAEAMPASRVLVNSPGSQGVCGGTTGLAPSFTLGCGTFGGNSTTDNVTYRHLVNIKRLAPRLSPEATPWQLAADDPGAGLLAADGSHA